MSSVLQPGVAYANVNGLRMYYEVSGAGPPLLLLHGGSMTTEQSFADQLAFFRTRNTIIAPEQQGHGHTADIDRELTYDQKIMAEFFDAEMPATTGA